MAAIKKKMFEDKIYKKNYNTINCYKNYFSIFYNCNYNATKNSCMANDSQGQGHA